jgi:hypothetical protein
MSTALLAAAVLTFAIAAAHSVLGECFVLTRLFRREGIPKLFGSSAGMTQTLRFAWHITSIAWCGMGLLLILMARGGFSMHRVALVISATFAVTGMIVLISSRGRHLAWLVFGLIALLTIAY